MNAYQKTIAMLHLDLVYLSNYNECSLACAIESTQLGVPSVIRAQVGSWIANGRGLFLCLLFSF